MKLVEYNFADFLNYTERMARTEPEVPSMKFVSLEGSETGTFLKPSFIFCNYKFLELFPHSSQI